jgi:prophage regulatory protein
MGIVGTVAFQALIDAMAAFDRPRAAQVVHAAPPSPPSAAASIVSPAEIVAEAILRLPEVKRRTGLSRSTIYERGRGSSQGGIPRRGVTGWLESDVREWIATRGTGPSGP